MQMTYEPRPDRDDRLASAIRIAKWASRANDLYEAHRKELLSIACWKATELDGYRNTRYRSTGVVTGAIGTRVNHEHVVTRRCLVSAMISHPDSCELLLTTASTAACLVTKEEHDAMRSSTAFAWDRYKEAGIAVIDMSDMGELDLGDANARIWAAIGHLLEDE